MSDESYYRDRGEEKNWPKLVLMILGALIIALIIFLLINLMVYLSYFFFLTFLAAQPQRWFFISSLFFFKWLKLRSQNVIEVSLVLFSL